LNVRPRAASIALALLLSASGIPSGVATPVDELTRAVAISGAASATSASARQFFSAYLSILARAKPNEVIWYVNAAVRLRPDLAPNIVVVTLNVHRRNMHEGKKRESCQEISDIVQAAVLVSPSSANAIVKAAVQAAPFARECIVAAASTAAPEQRLTFLQAARDAQADRSGGVFNGSYASIPTIGTINPADYTPPANVNSPEQPPQLR
jgi:hypothetical protein